MVAFSLSGNLPQSDRFGGAGEKEIQGDLNDPFLHLFPGFVFSFYAH